MRFAAIYESKDRKLVTYDTLKLCVEEYVDLRQSHKEEHFAKVLGLPPF